MERQANQIREGNAPLGSSNSLAGNNPLRMLVVLVMMTELREEERVKTDE
jgi:hypothetical protein